MNIKKLFLKYKIIKNKEFLITFIVAIGLFIILLINYFCINQKDIIENYGRIEKQDIYNIEDYMNNEDSVAYKTGFIKDEKGIIYVDDAYNKISNKCIKKIDGIEYLFDDNGYLAQGEIVYDVSYPNKYPINSYYPRLSDENGVYLSGESVYEVKGKKYFIDYRGEVARSWKENIVICDGKFYTKIDDDNNYYSYELNEINAEKVIEIYDYVLYNKRLLNINNKPINHVEFEKLSRENLIEELIEKYDKNNRDKCIYSNPTIRKNVNKDRKGFQNIEYNDYITEGLDDTVWTYYDDTTKGKIYLKSNNEYALDEIIKIGNKKYLFDKDNLLVENNVYTIGNKTYLTDKNGIIIEKEGIYNVKNIIDNVYKKDLYPYEMNYYVNKNGLVEKNKFIEYNGNIYYATESGNLFRNKYNGLLYFDDNCKLEKETIENNSNDLEEKNKKFFFDAIKQIKESLSEPSEVILNKINNKQKELVEKEYISNDNFKIKLNDQYIELKEFEKQNINDVVIEDINGNKIKNKFVSLGYRITFDNKKYSYMYFDYYVDENSKIIYNKIIDINKKKYIFDDLGKQVKNVWLFDYDYYKDKNKKSDINPYMYGYRVKRDLIKKYLGYYVTDYILTDNIRIENSFKYKALQDVEDSTEYDCFLVENGKYEYKYDYRFKGGEPFYGIYSKEINYDYKQIDEGVFKYVHNKKGRLNEATEINENDLTEQLSRYPVCDSKFSSDNDETVKFGSWYLYDKTGKTKDKLRWHILKKDKNCALLITEDIIDVRPFHNQNEDINWSTSDLRKWLNDEFYNEAFTDSEKKYIYSVRNEDFRYLTKNYNFTKDKIEKIGNVGESIDKVFILSGSEINYYLKDKINNEFIELQNANLSRYAKEKQKGIDMVISELSPNSYWTRETYETDNVAEVVDEYNIIHTNYIPVNSSYIGVRPVIWVKYNNKENNEYGKHYNYKEDLYYQYVVNNKDICVNDVKLTNKEDFSKQIHYCKELSDYNDGEVIEETDHIIFGHYEIDGSNNGVEGIKWTLLDKDEENGRALLVSKYIIDAKQYNEEGGDVTWETSSIRKWLNKDFFNDAFNDIEKDLIEETIVHTNDESEIISDTKYTTRGGNDTKDKIFLLSTDEIIKYMGHNRNLVLATITENINKNVRPEKYLYKNGDSYIEKYDERVYYSSYMTRSPGFQQNYIKMINPYRDIDTIFDSEYVGIDMISGYHLDGVRPAMWVKYK